MSEEITAPEKIWIVTSERSAPETATGARESSDIGGRIGSLKPPPPVVVPQRSQVEVAKLKAEMKGFLKAMRDMLDEADPPEAKIRLDEVELVFGCLA